MKGFGGSRVLTKRGRSREYKGNKGVRIYPFTWGAHGGFNEEVGCCVLKLD